MKKNVFLFYPRKKKKKKKSEHIKVCIQYQEILWTRAHVKNKSGIKKKRMKFKRNTLLFFGNEATLTMSLISNNENNGQNGRWRYAILEIESNLNWRKIQFCHTKRALFQVRSSLPLPFWYLSMQLMWFN